MLATLVRLEGLVNLRNFCEVTYGVDLEPWLRDYHAAFLGKPHVRRHPFVFFVMRAHLPSLLLLALAVGCSSTGETSTPGEGPMFALAKARSDFGACLGVSHQRLQVLVANDTFSNHALGIVPAFLGQGNE